ncbi:hypothetical protein [Azospirillum doebereinerae]
MRVSVLAVLGLGLLTTACGNTMEEKASTGALGGVAAGAVVGGPVGAVVGGVAGASAGAATEKIEERNDGSGTSGKAAHRDVKRKPVTSTSTTTTGTSGTSWDAPRGNGSAQ